MVDKILEISENVWLRTWEGASLYGGIHDSVTKREINSDGSDGNYTRIPIFSYRHLATNSDF